MKASVRRLINTSYGQRAKLPIQRLIGWLGFEVLPVHRPGREHLAAKLARCGIATVLDVGANRGQFGASMRLLGYEGAIFSIEPMGDAFAGLQAATSGDAAWSVRRIAAGRDSGSAVLNVSANSTSSSLLSVNETHLSAERSSRVVRHESVEVCRLDDIVAQERLQPPFFLKIDVQGAELDVLAGAGKTLLASALLQVELSVRELYTAGTDYLEVLALLRREGLVPVAWEPAFADPVSGDVLQIDALLCREDLL